jgi:hypothetical protein
MTLVLVKVKLSFPGRYDARRGGLLIVRVGFGDVPAKHDGYRLDDSQI